MRGKPYYLFYAIVVITLRTRYFQMLKLDIPVKLIGKLLFWLLKSTLHGQINSIVSDNKVGHLNMENGEINNQI